MTGSSSPPPNQSKRAGRKVIMGIGTCCGLEVGGERDPRYLRRLWKASRQCLSILVWFCQLLYKEKSAVRRCR